MKNKSRVLKITKAELAGRYRLKLFFSDGKVQTVDFGPFFRASLHPEIRKFLKPTNFKRFTIHDGELMWGDFDLIFPIIDLYKNTIENGQTTINKRAG